MNSRNSKLLKFKFKEFLLPTLLNSAAISITNLIDSIIVGQLLGEKSLAVIGIVSPVAYLINFFFFLTIIGGVTYAAVLMGQRDNEKVNKVFTLTMGFSLVVMIALTIILEIGSEGIITLLAGNDTELTNIVREYYTTLVTTGPALCLSTGVATFIRADGRPKYSMSITIFAGIVNLFLDFVFIGYMQMGIKGAALSTVIGYSASV